MAMTGAGILANYGKFFGCLVLGVVPGVVCGAVLLTLLLVPPRLAMEPVWVGFAAVAACALFSTAIFGLALRSGPRTPRRVLALTALLVRAGAVVAFIPDLLRGRGSLRDLAIVLAAGLVFLLLLFPVCILLGARRVGWGRVVLAGLLAFAAAAGGMLHVLWNDRGAMDGVWRLLLIALATLGFLPFARMERAE